MGVAVVGMGGEQESRGCPLASAGSFHSSDLRGRRRHGRRRRDGPGLELSHILRQGRPVPQGHRSAHLGVGQQLLDADEDQAARHNGSHERRDPRVGDLFALVDLGLRGKNVGLPSRVVLRVPQARPIVRREELPRVEVTLLFPCPARRAAPGPRSAPSGPGKGGRSSSPAPDAGRSLGAGERPIWQEGSTPWREDGDGGGEG